MSVLSSAQEQRYKLQQFVEESKDELNRSVKAQMDENFKIPGIVGEYERFTSFGQYILKNHEEVHDSLQRLSTASETLEHDLERKSKVLREELRGRMEKQEKEKQD